MQVVFHPGDTATESPAIFLGKGEQLTFVLFSSATNTPPDELPVIEFQATWANAIPRDPCACPPVPAVMPTVDAVSTLMCGGKAITLHGANPQVTIDRPQGFWVRAVVAEIRGAAGWSVAATKTSSDGCCCQSSDPLPPAG